MSHDADAALTKLARLLAVVLPANPFYTAKFVAAGLNPRKPPCELARLPFTTKAELGADQDAHPPYGSNLTFPLDRYSRLHQTSGTATGRPLRWLDTPESWDWMLGCWQQYFAVMGIGPGDRLFFPFSFGPFLGFWTAFEAAARAGLFVLPGGNLSTTARLRFLLEHRATVVFATPTYALRLAEEAAAAKLDLAGSAVRAVIVAGEPGGSIAGTRARIEAIWGARVFDHHGMTEVGPASVECLEAPGGLHILESEFLTEILEPGSDRSVTPGEPGELVLTNLGRLGSPLIRYRTGDIVTADPKPCRCGRHWLRLEGGIRGRTDDMIHLRGNNLYPSAVEAVVRRFPEAAEFRIVVDRAELRIEVEAPTEVAARIARAVRDEFLFRAEVRSVPPGSLPRFEMKAKRVYYENPSGDPAS